MELNDQAKTSATAVDKTQEQDIYPQPVIQQPIAQQPIVQQPISQQPYDQQPIVQQPYGQQPIVQQPVSQQPYDQQQLTAHPNSPSYPVQYQMPVMVRQEPIPTGTTQFIQFVKSDTWSRDLCDCFKSDECELSV